MTVLPHHSNHSRLGAKRMIKTGSVPVGIPIAKDRGEELWLWGKGRKRRGGSGTYHSIPTGGRRKTRTRRRTGRQAGNQTRPARYRLVQQRTMRVGLSISSSTTTAHTTDLPTCDLRCFCRTTAGPPSTRRPPPPSPQPPPAPDLPPLRNWCSRSRMRACGWVGGGPLR